MTRVSRGIRRSDVTGIPDKKERNVNKLAGVVHAHGCTVCAARYCDSCRTPTVNDRCRDCSGAMHGRSTWDISQDPQPCCRQHTQPATPDQMTTYKCAGDGLWWLCTTCYRTHPYNPATTRSNP